MVQREVSAIREPCALRRFARRTTRRSALLALAVSPLMLFGGALIPLAFGPAFEPARALFPVIMLGALMHLLSMPRALIFHALDRPERLSVGPAVGFAVWLVAAAWLVPGQGAMGAVYALVLARAAQALALTILVARAPFDEIGSTRGMSDGG